MKVRRLKVGVRPLEEGLQEFGGTLKDLQTGKILSKRGGVYFVSVESMRRVLTPSRMTLLHLIRTRHPRSIASLAKLIRRDFKNVHGRSKATGRSRARALGTGSAPARFRHTDRSLRTDSI